MNSHTVVTLYKVLMGILEDLSLAITISAYLTIANFLVIILG